MNFKIATALKSSVDILEDVWWYVNEYISLDTPDKNRKNADLERISEFLDNYNDNLRETIEEVCYNKSQNSAGEPTLNK